MLFSMMIVTLKIEPQKYNMIKVVNDNNDNSYVRSGNIYNIHLQQNWMVLSPGPPCLFFPIYWIVGSPIRLSRMFLLVELSIVFIIEYFLDDSGALIRPDKLVFSPDAGRHPLDCNRVAAGCWRIDNSWC